MSPEILCSIQAAIKSPNPFPVPPPRPSPSPQPQQQLQQRSLDVQSLIRRRDAAISLSIVALIQPSPASAFTFGISGPKDWLREQKKKSSKFVLAPIDASRNSLRTAYLTLTNDNADSGEKDFEEVRRLLKSASRDCIPKERNSFVSFQATTGVEVCTFKLVVKNASSLLDEKNPVKLEAEAQLLDLIKCFSFLSGLANEANIQIASNRQRVADALLDTISSLDKFEQGIKDCLEI